MREARTVIVLLIGAGIAVWGGNTLIQAFPFVDPTLFTTVMAAAYLLSLAMFAGSNAHDNSRLIHPGNSPEEGGKIFDSSKVITTFLAGLLAPIYAWVYFSFIRPSKVRP
jgi:hypothetical protein